MYVMGVATPFRSMNEDTHTDEVNICRSDIILFLRAKKSLNSKGERDLMYESTFPFSSTLLSAGYFVHNDAAERYSSNQSCVWDQY